MYKSIDKIFAEYLSKNLTNITEQCIEQSRQINNIIIWLSGMSTGLIVLFITQMNNLTIFPLILIKWVITFLMLSIISTILYRIFYHEWEIKYKILSLELEGFCLGYIQENMPIGLIKNWTIPDICKKLREYFGIDLSDFLDKNIPLEIWQKIYEENYLTNIQRDQENLKLLQKKILDIYGLSEKDIVPSEKTKKRCKLFAKICNYTYYAILIFFVVAVLMIFSYIRFFM